MQLSAQTTPDLKQANAHARLPMSCGSSVMMLFDKSMCVSCGSCGKIPSGTTCSTHALGHQAYGQCGMKVVTLAQITILLCRCMRLHESHLNKCASGMQCTCRSSRAAYLNLVESQVHQRHVAERDCLRDRNSQRVLRQAHASWSLQMWGASPLPEWLPNPDLA
jgi:hypothetical protein